jgi:hypothetical protein
MYGIAFSVPIFTEFVANQQNLKQIFGTDVFANLTSNVENKDELLFRPFVQISLFTAPFHASLTTVQRHSVETTAPFFAQTVKKCTKYGRNSPTAFSTV